MKTNGVQTVDRQTKLQTDRQADRETESPVEELLS